LEIENVKRASFNIAILTVLAVIGGLIVLFFILPSMNWSATCRPGQMESRLANYITSQWIRRNADEQRNPFRPNPENLKAGQGDFDEHCSGCHGLTGNGENRLEADFYPPVAKLTGETQKWSDGKLYFIIANGICMTGMPGSVKEHDPKEIWGMILWVRHLAQLSPPEKTALESRMRMTTEQHEEMMQRMHMSHPEPAEIRHPRNPKLGWEAEHH
jgi:mono/diheme cytochrome c family protein